MSRSPLARVVSSACAANRFVTVRLEGYGGLSAAMPDAEYQAPIGLYARPLDAAYDAQGEVDPTQACQALEVWNGRELTVQPTTDPRVVPLLPALAPGDSVLYGWRIGSATGIHAAAATGVINVGPFVEDKVAAARAPELLQYLDALESVITTIAGGTIPPTSAAVAAFKSATATIKAAITARFVDIV